MRIAYIAAGAGNMYCGACARDATLARGLIARGHNVQLIPLYTPMKLERHDLPMDAIYFGGVNVYLQQALALFRWLPAWLDRALDRPGFLRWVSKFGIEVEAKKLGPMTVSMLAGTHGRQKKEVQRLMTHLEAGFQPQVVNLTNSLLSGLAPELKRRLKVPVVCTYQGEEGFVADLPEPHRTRALELVRDNSRSIDCFICPSEALAASVARYLGVGMDKIRVVRTAVSPVPPAPRPTGVFTVGYLSVIRPVKGLDLLVEAVRILAKDENRDLRLVIGGRVMNPKYWTEVQKKIWAGGIAEVVDYVGEVDAAGKAALMARCHVFSLPSRYEEPRGVAVLEAMAAGLPAVVPANGVYPELLALGGGGVMVAPQDPPALARGIAQLMDDPPKRERLAKEARGLVLRHCSVEEMVDRTVTQYEHLLGT